MYVKKFYLICYMFAVIAAKCFGVSLFWSRCTSSSLLQWSYHI